MADRISVEPKPPQQALDRFKDVNVRPPSYSLWRNNLTGLSHAYNLYFVAVKTRIYIYTPSFPEQHLRSTPDLILTPPQTRTLTDFIPLGIDNTYPHSITHLIVGFLGNEEVVVVCCDDGDVAMYRTEAINDEIARREMGSEEPKEVDEMFSFHVSRSAWGLAIHTEARLLAVTCNAHTTTVFAFALARNEDDSMGDESMKQKEQADILDMFTTRVEDLEIDLEDTGDNLPCVAFNNTGADPSGRWLLTGDIGGTTHLWDIPTRTRVGHLEYKFCRRDEKNDCHCRERSSWAHGMWCLMWLDPNSFHRVSTAEEAVGLESPENESSGLSVNKDIWDISGTRHLWRESFHQPPTDPPLSVQPGNASSLLQAIQIAASPLHANADDLDLSSDYSSGDEDEDEEDHSPPTSKSDVLRFERFVEEHSRPSDSSRTSLPAVPPTPIMLISFRDIFLLQSPPFTTVSGFADRSVHSTNPTPVIGMNAPLAGNGRHEMVGWSAHMDRLNMNACISELGVVVIGTQRGFVGVFKLTTVEHEGHTIGSFRLDCVVPTPEQDKRWQHAKHSHGPLIGVSVGPVQGQNRKLEGSRRWRMILTYQDNCVCSYEIGKKLETNEIGGENIEALVL